MPDQRTSSDTIEHEKQTIRDVVGLTNTEDIQLNETGWDSRVYSFNEGKYFFKFPRSTKIQGRYLYEIAAIKFVNRIDTDVVSQKILWEHPENAYFGYEGVSGQPVSSVIHKLSKAQKQDVGSKLGGFLREFHKLTLPGARNMSLKDESEQIKRWYEMHMQAMTEYFSQSEQATLRTLVYDVWPAKILELGADPVLSHGDLHFDNVLYGHDGSIGVIDFGDVGYYDRSKDFLELNEDDHLFTAVLDAYGHFDHLLSQKVAVRQDMIQIINFGFHVGKGNTLKAKERADRIRALL